MKATLALLALSSVLIAGCSSSGAVHPDSSSPTTVTPSPSSHPSATASPAAKSAVGTTVKEVRCQSGRDERIIMFQPNPPGCEVYYSKPGVPDPQVVAVSKHTPQYCLDTIKKIQNNLVKAGFSCK